MNNLINRLYQKVKEKKNLFIYGTGSQGRGLLQTFLRTGIRPSGFIDKNPMIIGQKILGIPVFSPSILDNNEATKNYLIVIATFFFQEEITTFLRSKGFKENEGYFLYTSLKPYDYVVEVSGICNLRCISCPRAERVVEKRHTTMMNLEDFQKVISKIRSEAPFVGNIQLYQWGEPTMNRFLPEMIQHSRENGILCTISSNLNYNADFKNIIKSKPECFRISVSGIEDNYEITHTGGKWNTFIKNIQTVSKFREKFYPEMKVELYFHRYKHNTKEEENIIREICSNLKFEFHSVPAYLISLDDVLEYCEGKPLPSQAQKARNLLLVDLDEGIRYSMKEKSYNCETSKVIMINADLSVSTCMMFYNSKDNSLCSNYLETSLPEIISRKSNSSLCIRCKKYALHRYCSVYAKIGEKDRY
ncbi:MAG TPA: hypothetical protein P5239_09560 [Victivallales bacterium]|nr:hypothetical protein [Victivallales bacterium]